MKKESLELLSMASLLIGIKLEEVEIKAIYEFSIKVSCFEIYNERI